MNASPDDHDGPVTRVAEFLRSMPNRGPQILNHALASPYNTNIEDSNMTLIEESKVPSPCEIHGYPLKKSKSS